MPGPQAELVQQGSHPTDPCRKMQAQNHHKTKAIETLSRTLRVAGIKTQIPSKSEAIFQSWEMTMLDFVFRMSGSPGKCISGKLIGGASGLSSACWPSAVGLFRRCRLHQHQTPMPAAQSITAAPANQGKGDADFGSRLPLSPGKASRMFVTSTRASTTIAVMPTSVRASFNAAVAGKARCSAASAARPPGTWAVKDTDTSSAKRRRSRRKAERLKNTSSSGISPSMRVRKDVMSSSSCGDWRKSSVFSTFRMIWPFTKLRSALGAVACDDVVVWSSWNSTSAVLVVLVTAVEVKVL
mmetsp:Transcript_16405/g.30911  ORF Transcript_16405/g.30911 Transcript_16405/m.30911 type:complete len:297 (-) Transcript_16405:729-1619(-)